LDENFLKPLLIYNYKERKDDIAIAKKLHRKAEEEHEEKASKLIDDDVREMRLLREKEK
jgi:hypothetical protein